MSMPINQSSVSGAVAVVIDKSKGSQYAIKWATENLILKGETIVLIHVKDKISSPPFLQTQPKEIFFPFRVYCHRKNIRCQEVILEDEDAGVAKSLIEYTCRTTIRHLVLGLSTQTSLLRNFFIRTSKVGDIHETVAKRAPDFCSVYVATAKGKIQLMRSTCSPGPTVSGNKWAIATLVAGAMVTAAVLMPMVAANKVGCHSKYNGTVGISNE